MIDMAYGYDPSIDYQKLINKALAAQDYRSAAIYEQQRNEKIAGEGAVKYKPTAHYADYLPKTQQVNAGLDALQGAGAFAYDVNKDPSYQALYKQALREADRQTRDTMGAYAAMTGGVPSTAAVSAAQQAGNYERSKLNDAIPTLYQNAYSRWLQGQENERANVNLLAGLDSQAAQESLQRQQFAADQAAQAAALERQKQLDAMDRWAQLGTADEAVSAVLGVPVGTSTASHSYQLWSQQMGERQQGWQESTDAWQQGQTEQSSARELALYLLQLGQMPNDQILTGAGLDRATAQQLMSGYAAQAAKSSGGSGYRRSSKKDDTEEGDEETAANLRAQAVAEVYNRTPIGTSSYAAKAIESAMNPNTLSSFGQRIYSSIPSRIRTTSELYDWILEQYDNSGLSEAQKERDLNIFLQRFGSETR